MKFAYIDESGCKDHDEIFVMAGVLIDAYKLRKATAEFDQKLKDLRRQHPSKPNDFKASRIINGKGGWSKVCPRERKQFFTDIVNHVVAVGHIYAFALSFERFEKATQSIDALPSNQDHHWVACSMYLSSLIQKKVQKEKKSKGLSVLIFDDNKQHMPKLSNGLYDCNKWYDDLYAVKKTSKNKIVWKLKGERFDHIINSAFAIKSEHSSLVQVADIISYIYRRFLELCNSNEAYEGEKQLYEDWVNHLDTKREKIGHVPKDSETIKFYKDVCHPNWEM